MGAPGDAATCEFVYILQNDFSDYRHTACFRCYSMRQSGEDAGLVPSTLSEEFLSKFESFIPFGTVVPTFSRSPSKLL